MYTRITLIIKLPLCKLLNVPILYVLCYGRLFQIGILIIFQQNEIPSKTRVPVGNICASRICPNIFVLAYASSNKEERLDFRSQFFFRAHGNKMVAQIVSNGGLNQRHVRVNRLHMEEYCRMKKSRRNLSLARDPKYKGDSCYKVENLAE